MDQLERKQGLMAKKYHVTTTVNGDDYEFLCEPQQTLLDVLRDELMLSGTKEYRIKVAGVLARRTAQQALERARQN